MIGKPQLPGGYEEVDRCATDDDWNRLYDILIAECDATEYWRQNFVGSMSDGCREYRFGGSLGFGGKLRNNSNGVYVDCYQENITPEREKDMKAANIKIEKWVNSLKE